MKTMSIRTPNRNMCPVLIDARPNGPLHLRRETNVELQATNNYNRIGHDPDAPDAASGTGAG